MNKIVEKIKTFGRETYYFLSSRIFWGNFGKMLGLIALAIFMIFWLMKCFTRHGDAVKVGNYVDKSMREAEKKADNDGGFDLVVTDSVYREDFPPDMILEQNPLPNSYVKPGRTIYVKITTTRGSLVRVPDVSGNDEISGYIESLKSIKLKAGRIDSINDPNLGDGTIMQVFHKGQDIMPQLGQGVFVPQGTALDFRVSKNDPLPEVPKFTANGRYYTLEEYGFILESQNLKVGEIVKDESVTDERSAYVVRISHSPGIRLAKGDSVSVFITQKNPTASKVESFD